MSIQYTTKCAGDLGMTTSSGRVVARLFIVNHDILRFHVYDVSEVAVPYIFETLRGADEKLFEIARREEAREENARRLANEQKNV